MYQLDFSHRPGRTACRQITRHKEGYETESQLLPTILLQQKKKKKEEKKPQAQWFSVNISLIQSQHIYIHSGFKPIIVSVRSNSLKVIARGPHTKENLLC